MYWPTYTLSTESTLPSESRWKASLCVEGLTKVYPNGCKANDAITLEAREGEVVGLIGPNGAGKTTLIRQILGLLAPTEGAIHVLGRQLPSEAERLRGRIGFVPQMPLQYPALTPLELITAIIRMKGRSRQAARQAASKYLCDVGLEEMQERYGYQLSYGSIKLMNLAMALCQEPELLVLDEPTSMVDVVNRDRIRRVISSQRDRCVFLASHDLAEVQSVCGRSYLLAQGRVIAEGTPGELAALVSSTTHLAITVPYGETLQLTLDGVELSSCEENTYSFACASLKDALAAVSAVLKGKVPYEEVRLISPSLEDVVLRLLENVS